MDNDQTQIKSLRFSLSVGVSEADPVSQIINHFSVTIICFDENRLGANIDAGVVVGYYINNNHQKDPATALIDDFNDRYDDGAETEYECLRDLFDSEKDDGTLDTRVRELCGNNLSNEDVLVIHSVYLKPEFRHRGLGLKAIRETVTNLSKSAGVIAVRIYPDQTTLDWKTVSSRADMKDNTRFMRMVHSHQRTVWWEIEDLSEFEHLTDAAARRKLVSYFRSAGLETISESGNLMVTSPSNLTEH